MSKKKKDKMDGPTVELFDLTMNRVDREFRGGRSEEAPEAIAHDLDDALDALRDRNPTFVRLHDGAVRNGYTLKIANHTFHPQTVEVGFRGLAGARLRSPGEAAGGPVRAIIPANEVRAVRVFVTADPAEGADASLPAAFVIRSAAGAIEIGPKVPRQCRGPDADRGVQRGAGVGPGDGSRRRRGPRGARARGGRP